MDTNYSNNFSDRNLASGLGRVDRAPMPILFVAAGWRETLLSAKAAYQKGQKDKALMLYRAGLESAHRALSDRTELTEFLIQHIWT